jgi:putative SOS response-associated peptidase YedK
MNVRCLPGIWRRYLGPVRKDGPNVELEVYAFLTTTPNQLVATINHERMPVLLTREEEFEGAGARSFVRSTRCK